MSLLDAIMKPQEKTISIACEGSMFVRLEELNELQSYKNLTDEAYQKAKTSIIELGFSFPIFVWENEGKMWIIDAHQRKRVLTRLRDVEGYIIPPLPAVRIHAKDKVEAKKKILAQESQYGDITEEGLYEFMNEEGFELDETELETFVDIDEFNWEQEATEVTEDEAPEVSSEPAKSELGKVYQLGRHRLMCGDATKIEDVEKLMNGQKADMVFTDPPYGYSYESNHQDTHKELLNDDKILDFMPMAWEATKENAPFYVFCGWQTVDKWINTVKDNDLKLKNIIIWKKNNWSMGDLTGAYAGQYEMILFAHKGRIEIEGERDRDVWEFDREAPTDHPTIKPVNLVAHALRNHKVDNVLDLFGGSGSTLIACEQTNRTCFMLELDEKYVDVVRRRYHCFVTGSEEGWENGTPAIS